jgi:hypothetical protein
LSYRAAIIAGMSTPTTYSIGDDELVDDWSTTDLLSKVEQGDAEALAMVLRVVAARLDRTAADGLDARNVLLDLSCSIASLTSATEKVFRTAAEHVFDDDEGAEIATKSIAKLDDASTGLRMIADGWI